jgi:hypothetical protein
MRLSWSSYLKIDFGSNLWSMAAAILLPADAAAFLARWRPVGDRQVCGRHDADALSAVDADRVPSARIAAQIGRRPLSVVAAQLATLHVNDALAFDEFGGFTHDGLFSGELDDDMRAHQREPESPVNSVAFHASYLNPDSA